MLNESLYASNQEAIKEGDHIESQAYHMRACASVSVGPARRRFHSASLDASSVIISFIGQACSRMLPVEENGRISLRSCRLVTEV